MPFHIGDRPRRLVVSRAAYLETVARAHGKTCGIPRRIFRDARGRFLAPILAFPWLEVWMRVADDFRPAPVYAGKPLPEACRDLAGFLQNPLLRCLADAGLLAFRNIWIKQRKRVRLRHLPIVNEKLQVPVNRPVLLRLRCPEAPRPAPQFPAVKGAIKRSGERVAP